MAYTIKNADGTILTNLVDGKVDTKTTSITLIGKNTDKYGAEWNNNLVKMLENFASTSPPNAPLVGQLWYNKADGRLKVFTLDGVFGEISAAILSPTTPTILKQGDLWIDTRNDQLFFTKNGTNTILAGPIYSSQLGKSGWVCETFVDDTSVTRSVTSLYSNGVLLGMLSTATFTIAPSENVTQNNQGMFEVHTGLTLNLSIPENQFAGTASNAISVQGVTPELYLLKNNGGSNQIISGTGNLTINSDSGLLIGDYADVALYASGGQTSRRSSLRNNIADSPLELITKTANKASNNGFTTVLTAYRNRVGVNLDGQLPGTTFHVEGDTYINGSALVTGNLTIQGTSTVVSTVILQIQDKNIELASSSSWYTDTLIEGGGITLHGSTDKTILYHNSSTSWKSNIDWNINSGRSYKVSDITVLTSSTLGTSVTKSYLTRVGVMEEVTVTNVIIKGNGITNNEGNYAISGITVSTATNLSTGTEFTVNLVSKVPILTTGSTVTIDGIINPGFAGTYSINTVTNTGPSTSFTLSSVGVLTTTTPFLGANPVAIFRDLMLNASTNGDIDATQKRIKNVKYSTVPTDVATVQYANDVGSVVSLKGIAITIDITSMANPDTEIATLLTKLVPPTNQNFSTSTYTYSSEPLYDLPEGYRARVLCQRNSVRVANLPINVVTTVTNVMKSPDGSPVGAISYLAVSPGILNTATSIVYTVKEFRIVADPSKRWLWIRDIN